MNDDLLILNGLDQSLSVDDSGILEQVTNIVAESLEQKDPYIALKFGANLIMASQLAGMGLAKLFYLMRENWDNYGREDDFDEVAYDYVGRTKSTVDKYVRVWEMYEQDLIPEELSSEIRQKNIKDQIPIASLLSQGYEPDEDEWQDLADAPDNSSVLAKVREIKGTAPRKGALLIYLTPDGTLQAEQQGKVEYVGYLNIDEEGEIKQKAIQRLLKSAGVLYR